MPGSPHYRFGPLERRGVLLGWRGGQIASAVVGLVAGVVALRVLRGAAGGFTAVAGVALSFATAWLPLRGRTAEEWVPTVLRWGWECLLGTPRSAPERRWGHIRILEAPLEPCRGWPWSGAAPAIGGAGLPGRRAGVVHDAARQTLSVVLRLSSEDFALLGPEEKERQVADWSAVLAAVAREGSAVHRLQWLVAATPDDGRALWSYYAAAATLDAAAPARRSYAALLHAVSASLVRHHVWLCVQLRLAGRTARAVKAAGGGLRGGCSVLLREASNIERALGDAGVTVRGLLDPRQLTGVLKETWEPSLAEASPAAPERSAGAAEWPGARTNGTAPRATPAPTLWPRGLCSTWARVRTDSTWHATYWVAEWPRVGVGPEFLAPVLLGQGRRAFTVVMEPIEPARAYRMAQRARTADVAESELRRRGGFLSSARRAREAEVARRREAELADGHGSYRFSGYLRVTALSATQLEADCEAAEQDAAQAGLELHRLQGEQERGLLSTLPLGVGLR